MDATQLLNAARRVAGPGERVMWVGEPRQGLFLRRSDLVTVPLSLAWFGFAVFWTLSATSAGAPPFFTLWGCMFIAFGCYLVIGRFYADMWRRRGALYVLTDQRLIACSAKPKRAEVSTSLHQLGSVEVMEHSRGRGTIRYGTAKSRPPLPGMLMPAGWPGASQYQRPMLDSITDARRVYNQLFSAAQAAAAPPAA